MNALTRDDVTVLSRSIDGRSAWLITVDGKHYGVSALIHPNEAKETAVFQVDPTGRTAYEQVVLFCGYDHEAAIEQLVLKLNACRAEVADAVAVLRQNGIDTGAKFEALTAVTQ